MALSKSVTNYRIVPFKPEHLEQIEGRYFLNGMGKEEALKSYEHGPAFSGFFKDELVAIAGVTILWPGTGEAWALFGKTFREHKFFLHREVLRHLRWIAAKWKLKRIQACALSDNQTACEWLYHLGFNYEGEMKKYWGGKDFARYGRIF